MFFLEQTYLHSHYMNLMEKLQFNLEKVQISVLTWKMSWLLIWGPVSLSILSLFICTFQLTNPN